MFDFMLEGGVNAITLVGIFGALLLIVLFSALFPFVFG